MKNVLKDFLIKHIFIRWNYSSHLIAGHMLSHPLDDSRKKNMRKNDNSLTEWTSNEGNMKELVSRTEQSEQMHKL